MNMVGTWIKRTRVTVILIKDFQFPLDTILEDDKLEGTVFCS